MNMNMNDILARLEQGESVDAIAQEFTNALNEAVQEQKRIEEPARLEKEKAENKERRVSALADILELLNDWLTEYYPEFGTVEDDPAELVDVIDRAKDDIVEVIAVTNELLKFLDKGSKTVKTETHNIMSPKGKEKKTVDEKIFEFMRDCGLA